MALLSQRYEWLRIRPTDDPAIRHATRPNRAGSKQLSKVHSMKLQQAESAAHKARLSVQAATRKLKEKQQQAKAAAEKSHQARLAYKQARKDSKKARKASRTLQDEADAAQKVYAMAIQLAAKAEAKVIKARKKAASKPAAKPAAAKAKPKAKSKAQSKTVSLPLVNAGGRRTPVSNLAKPLPTATTKPYPPRRNKPATQANVTLLGPARAARPRHADRRGGRKLLTGLHRPRGIGE